MMAGGTSGKGQIGMTKRTTPVLNTVIALFVLVWLVLLPVSFVVHWILGDHWILQRTWKVEVAVVITAAVLFALVVSTYLWSTWSEREPLSWSGIVGLACYSLLSGWSTGNVVLNVLNHTNAAIPQFVQFKIVRLQRNAVDIRALGEAYDGITFWCGLSLWRASGGYDKGTAPGRLYRGKLGLYWAEIPEK
jgi:hypothetical protein